MSVSDRNRSVDLLGANASHAARASDARPGPRDSADARDARRSVAIQPDTPEPREAPWGIPSLLRLKWLRLPEGLDPASRPVRLGLASLLAIVAVAIRYVTQTSLGGDLGYVTYVAAVAVSAWLAGLGGGLLTTAICTVAQGLIFSGAAGSQSLTQPIAVLRIAVFLVDGALISAITSALRRLSFREHQDRAIAAERYRAERDAHGRAEASRLALERLQTITATLAQAATPREVADTVLERGIQALGAAAGGVGRVSADGKAVETITTRGYPAEAVDPSVPYSLDTPSHFSQAVQTRTATFISNAAEWQERFPEAPARMIDGRQAEAALAVVPLLARDGVIGALTFRFDEARDFGDGTGELIFRLADQCAQALDRVTAYQEQRLALEALERANRRLDFLARASEVLGSTKEPEAILRAVAKLATGTVAAWCVIEMFDPDRPSVSVANARAGGAAVLRELASIAPQNLAAWMAPDAAETGASLVRNGEALRARLSSPRAAELLALLGDTSVLVVPVMHGDAWVGAVTLGAQAADPWAEMDMAMAQDLAARIATTLERTNLYGTVSRFKTTVDASLDAVYMFDPRSLALTYVNRGASVQAGAQASELIGLSVLELQRQFSTADLRARIQPLLTGDVASIGYTGMLSRRDGGETPIEALLQCVRLPDGTVTLVLTARDVSEQIEVQARLSRVATGERRRAAELNAILEAMREGILVVDGSGRVTLANSAATEICGSTPETLAQLAAALGVQEEALPHFHTRLDERTIDLPDGRWIEISGYPTERAGVPDPAETGTSILVLRDVTRSRETAQAQEAFMGVLSHELRTPVTSIYGYAKVLQRPGLHGKAAEMLSDIESEADRLYRIVEDLLALSRVQAGFTVEGEPLLLQHLVKPLIAAEALRWPQINVDVRIPSDLPTVFGERTYVEQVLRNLVSNAAKYSPAGTTVTITARATGSEVELRVLDRGVGIAPGEADQLFRLFYRSPNTARQAAGAGIGLYVCRGLVHAMGGRIWAARRADGGSEFGFSLPVPDSGAEDELGG